MVFKEPNAQKKKKKKNSPQKQRNQTKWKYNKVELEKIGYLSIIILPDSTSNLMSAQIKGLEFDFSNTQLLGRGVLGRLMLN